MACENNKGNQGRALAVGQQIQRGRDIAQLLKQNQLPDEKIVQTQVLATSHSQAKNLSLERGQYRVQGYVPANEYESYEQFKRDLTKLIPQGSEKKRVHFHKIDVGARQRVRIDGEQFLAHPYTLVFTVIDNPLPLAPIVWGASIIGSATAGWFVIDKVETFTESGTGQFITIAAALATLGGLYLAFKN